MNPNNNELKEYTIQLEAALTEILHICSYGWTDIKKECSKIDYIARQALYDNPFE